ncbi:MAG: hypothetical protein K0R63_1510 [Rickettsiales bacterium]|jgi:hypothetical protein|nr:hypothetical protein [Rickettsiales bacterium]
MMPLEIRAQVTILSKKRAIEKLGRIRHYN